MQLRVKITHIAGNLSFSRQSGLAVFSFACNKTLELLRKSASVGVPFPKIPVGKWLPFADCLIAL
ncbi:hypothetical protein [Lunatimonas lonarensis]|uniref:hypothetical protein n=1 Tax=Lunatimonas lonarensis TaxID=1232681 RepID=UPI00056A06E4|nr:hypothetical protein [Lunatimonas lonarensis]